MIDKTKKIIILIMLMFSFGFSLNSSVLPRTYYRVYLDNELLGLIEDKDELENYIDEKGEEIKKELNVDKVYSPNGLEIKKITTFDTNIKTVEQIYKEIESKKSFTVKGYQFTINKSDDTSIKLYVLDDTIFKNAIVGSIVTFIGTDEYNNYLEGTSSEIEDTGSVIENVYVNNNITYKSVNIPVTEKIYTDSDTISQFLLFGEEKQSFEYTVQAGETIEEIALNNQITIEELILSNDELTSKNNLLYEGQKLSIVYLNPQIQIVVETHEVADVETAYQTIEQYDDDKLLGYDEVINEGSNGLDRVTRKVKYINGYIVYVHPVSKETLVKSTNKVVVKGTKELPNVGTLDDWFFPCNTGYVLSDDYGWRIDPATGLHKFHNGVDLAGTGYGSGVYASNNGTVVEATYNDSFGYYIIVNHNNGYKTRYAHLSKILVSVGETVTKGETIGLVGSTGYSTGPHLHFEVFLNDQLISPWSVIG